MHSGLTKLPLSFAAGSTVTYTRSYAEFPAPEWTLTLRIRGADTLDIVADGDGSGFQVTIDAADSAELPAGNYQWTEEVSKDDENYVVARGRVNILPNFETAEDGDVLSFEEKLLPLVEARINGRVTKDLDSYTADGMQVSKLDFKSLLKLRNSLVTAINAQRSGGKSIQTILIAHTPMGGLR